MIAHRYGCSCERCRTLAAAVSAENPDGTPFFTHTELLQLAAEPGDDDPELVWFDDAK
jgi:predicted metal-dependent phosphotriesterase family hydrolase